DPRHRPDRRSFHGLPATGQHHHRREPQWRQPPQPCPPTPHHRYIPPSSSPRSPRRGYYLPLPRWLQAVRQQRVFRGDLLPYVGLPVADEDPDVALVRHIATVLVLPVGVAELVEL